jgi:hypothetical protein
MTQNGAVRSCLATLHNSFSNPCCAEVISVLGDQAAFSFSMEYWHRTSVPEFPGYNLQLSFDLASLRFIILSRMLKELGIYASLFTRMFSMFQRSSSSSSGSSSRGMVYKFDVKAGNPVLIVPRDSEDDESIVLDLGRIDIANELLFSDDKKLLLKDTIRANMEGLQIVSRVGGANSVVDSPPLLQRVGMEVVITRNLSIRLEDPSPDILVSLSVPSISLVLPSDRLVLITGIVSGNITETPRRPDDDELRLVSGLLLSGIPRSGSGDDLAPASEQSPSTTTGTSFEFVLRIDEATVEFAFTYETPEDLETSSLMLFSLRRTAITAGRTAKGVSKYEITAEELWARDTRPGIPMQQRVVLSPHGSSDGTGRQIGVSYSIDSALGTSHLHVALYRPRIYAVPSHMDAFFSFLLPIIRRGIHERAKYDATRVQRSLSVQTRQRAILEGDLRAKQSLESQRLWAAHQSAEKRLEQRMAVSRSTYGSDPAQLQVELSDSLAMIRQNKLDYMRKASALQQKHAAEIQELLTKLESQGIIVKEEAGDSNRAYVAEEKSTISVSTFSIVVRGPEVRCVFDFNILLSSLRFWSQICVFKDYEKVSDCIVLRLGDTDVSGESKAKSRLIRFTLKAFGVVKGAIHPTSRQLVGAVPLVEPVDVSIDVRQNEGASTYTAVVQISHLNGILSYGDVRSLLATWDQIKDSMSSVQSRLQKEQQLVEAAYSAFEAVSSVAQQKAGELAKKVAAPTATKTLGNTVQIVLEDSIVCFLDDSAPPAVVPLLRARMEVLTTTVALHSASTDAFVKLKGLSLNSYNNDLSGYEPVVEPWNADISAVVDFEAKRTSIRASSEDTLNLNVCKSFFDAISNMQSFLDTLSVSKPISQSSGSGSSSLTDSGPLQSSSTDSSLASLAAQGRSFSPYAVRNLTSLPISVWISGEQSEQNAISLQPGEESPIRVQTNTNLQLAMEGSTKYFLDAKIDTGSQSKCLINRVPLDLLQISPHVTTVDGKMAIWISEVTRVGGAKILTLRTNFVIENTTPQDLEVLCMDPNNYPSTQELFLAAGEVRPVPFKFVGLKTVLLRPSSPSAQGKENKWTWIEYAPGGIGGPVRCHDHSTGSVWNACLKVSNPEISGTGENRISILPSVTVENSVPSPIALKFSADRGATWPISTHVAPATEENVWYSKAKPLSEQVVAVQVAGFQWSQPIEISRLMQLASGDSPGREPIILSHPNGFAVRIFVEVSRPTLGSLHLCVFPLFWIVNQSGLAVSFRMNQNVAPIVLENEHRFDPTSDPLMWYSKLRLASSKMYFSSEEIEIQVAGGPWSQRLKMPSGRDFASQSQLLLLSDASQSAKLPVMFSASPAQGRFWRSTEVRLLPPAMLVNTCDREIVYRQSGSISRGWHLPAHKSVPLLWEKIDGPRFLQIKFANQPTEAPLGILSSPSKAVDEMVWSGEFAADRIENFCAKIRKRSGEYELVSVSVKMDGFVRYVIFRPYEAHALVKVRFLNNTEHTVMLQQEGCEFADPVEPMGELNFEWDEPHHTKKRIVLSVRGPGAGRPVSFSPESIARPVDLQLYENVACTIAAATHLYSRVVVLAPRMPHSEILSLFPWMQLSGTKAYVVDFQVNNFNMSASLIDPNAPVEVGQLTLSGAKIVVLRSGTAQYKCSADVATLQLDNHLYQSPFPVMAVSLPNETNAPALRFSCDMDLTDPKVKYFGDFSVQAQTLEVGLDDVIIFRLASVMARLLTYLSRKEICPLSDLSFVFTLPYLISFTAQRLTNALLNLTRHCPRSARTLFRRRTHSISKSLFLRRYVDWSV